MKQAEETSNNLVCPTCQMANQLSARVCASCGESLAVPLAQHYLDRAEEDIARSDYDSARLNLGRADAEMFVVSPEQRRASLLTARAFYLQGLIYFQGGQMADAKNELLLTVQTWMGKQVATNCLLAP